MNELPKPEDQPSIIRNSKSGVDMIVAARQLLEKCREHDDVLFVLFLNLKKAYHSVPRDALWGVLRKCGVPPTTPSVMVVCWLKSEWGETLLPTALR